jgi:hypothetical protein
MRHRLKHLIPKSGSPDDLGVCQQFDTLFIFTRTTATSEWSIVHTNTAAVLTVSLAFSIWGKISSLRCKCISELALSGASFAVYRTLGPLSDVEIRSAYLVEEYGDTQKAGTRCTVHEAKTCTSSILTLIRSLTYFYTAG